MSDALLEFRSAALPLPDLSRTRPLSFALRPGEVGLVSLPDEVFGLPIADAACGLVSPASGEVHFRGSDWARMGASEESRQRGAIGRVFEGRAWMSNLDLDENIVLASVHQGRSRVECLREAAELAAKLGLAAIPAKRPSWITPRESLLAQWTRALLGGKPLLVLELPTRAIDAREAARCAAVLAERLKAGAAALVVESSDHLAWLRNLPVSFTLTAQDVQPEIP